MERGRPKTVHELFKETDPKAECAGATSPIEHKWYVFRGEEKDLGAIPPNVLYVLCRDCGANAIIKGCMPYEWKWAQTVLDGQPRRLPDNQRHRILPKNICQRRPEAWYDLTLGRYGEPPDD